MVVPVAVIELDEATAALDASNLDARVLQLPGQEFGAFLSCRRALAQLVRPGIDQPLDLLLHGDEQLVGAGQVLDGADGDAVAAQLLDGRPACVGQRGGAAVGTEAKRRPDVATPAPTEVGLTAETVDGTTRDASST